MKCALKVRVSKGLRQQWGEMLGKSRMTEKCVRGELKKAHGWDRRYREPEQKTR